MVVHTAPQPTDAMRGDVYAANQLDWMTQTEDNETYLQGAIQGLRDVFGDGFISGSGTSDTFVAIGTGLTLDVIAHKSLIGTVITITEAQVIPLTASSDLFVWEYQDNADGAASYTTTLTNTNPEDDTRLAQYLGEAVTDGSSVTSWTPGYRVLSVNSNKRVSEVGTTWDSTTGSDGSDHTMTLDFTPRTGSDVKVYDNGLKRIAGTHYTVSVNVVTFLSGFYPLTGHSVEVEYEPT